MKSDLEGHPIAFDLTGGEAADGPRFETLVDLGPDLQPRGIVADKGYDSAANRKTARKQGILPVIPHRRHAKILPKLFAKALHGGRARLEQVVGRFKRFKRIALRCEKTARNSDSFVPLAAALILLKSVHTA